MVKELARKMRQIIKLPCNKSNDCTRLHVLRQTCVNPQVWGALMPQHCSTFCRSTTPLVEHPSPNLSVQVVMSWWQSWFARSQASGAEACAGSHHNLVGDQSPEGAEKQSWPGLLCLLPGIPHVFFCEKSYGRKTSSIIIPE